MARERGAIRLIRLPELLEILGVSEATIWRWEKRGQFPRRKRIFGNVSSWREDEVREWLDQHAPRDDRG